MQRAKRLDLIPPYLFGEIAAAKRKAIAEGRDLIDLGIGDPDQPTPAPVIEKLAQFARNPETHRYDESSAGDPQFLHACATWFQKRFGVTLDPDTELLLLIGSKEGLAHLCWAYVDPGDYTLVPDPAYTVPKVNTLLAGGTPYPLPLTAENKFLPDLSAIPTDVARKAKILFLNYPHNPTGAVATPEFFAEAVRFAREYDLLICQDCAYSEVGYEGYQAPSILQTPGAREVAIETHSLSKTLNMTGWRIGFAAGNADAIAALNKIKSNVDSKQFAAIDRAAGWALLQAHQANQTDQAGQADQADMGADMGMGATFALYQRRRDLLVEGLNGLGWRLEKPQAAFYVWLPCPPGYTSRTFATALLEQAGVLVIPGLGYGEHGDGYVRLSLTVPDDKAGERVQEAVDRIKKHIPIRW
ncbi:MAG: LL-diaminopimelate aminotransferase [Cytophagales bacterium]|nr:LL-diaminopimelate aminotransferase [Armatimonadota bacterium]